MAQAISNNNVINIGVPLTWQDNAYNLDGTIKVPPNGGKGKLTFFFPTASGLQPPAGASIDSSTGRITATDPSKGFSSNNVSVAVKDEDGVEARVVIRNLS